MYILEIFFTRWDLFISFIIEEILQIVGNSFRTSISCPIADPLDLIERVDVSLVITGHVEPSAIEIFLTIPGIMFGITVWKWKKI